ncbi:MAG TPA: lysophospholipid acyltransferase family protein [Bacteroidia bacterium]|jgi:KDO2-lipid IV(A) lauroyltransferase|nr:lysophospholipid acyltransferase family protein [Bacteroidia bacterium]
MNALLFYLAIPFIYLISALPFWLFYGFSDLFFVMIFYVAGYRKKVVLENLRRSFPEKSEEELKKIRIKFYRFFCDFVLETLKTLTISRRSMLKRCRLNKDAVALFDKYHREKKSFIIVMGHYGNWEWAGNTFSLTGLHQLYVIFHPLSNKHFNNLIIKMRTRFGTKLIEMRNTIRDMLSKRNELSATAFIADQTPPPESAYWTKFLNQDTPVFWGTEKIARKINYPIVFVNVKRVKRGYYEISAETLVENPAGTAEGQISEMHTRRLEQEIIKQPELWLWSHRRWKHKKPGT